MWVIPAVELKRLDARMHEEGSLRNAEPLAEDRHHRS